MKPGNSMVAVAPTPPTRNIRVYCPTHKVSFSASASSVVQCDSQKHTLSTDFRSESFWEYCCDCQHYWPLDAAKGNIATDECPVCERSVSRSFLCEECNVVSVESDTPGRRKEYSISAEGLPNPSCPGCLHKPKTKHVQHDCADFGRTFSTNRLACPFCDQPLDPEPVFPCSVTTLRSSMRRRLTTLQFDSQSNLLTESAGGAYLLLEGNKSTLPITIPNRSHLSSKQDYYSCYYELFNCDNAAAGEIVVLSPAVIQKVEKGWALIEPGSLEIKVSPEEPQEEPSNVCRKCGTQVNPCHTFCKRCGSPLQSDEADLSVESTAPDIHQDNKFQELAETTANSTEPHAHTPDYHWKPILGVVGGLAAFGIILVIVISLSISGNSVEKKLDGAIKAGNLFAPANENAHDLYLQLKNSGASDQTLRPYRERILPLLTTGPLQMIKTFMVPGSDEVPLAEWQGAARSLRWATELKPDDGGLQARTLYAEGRIAYLSKDENSAISTWERAADADPSWPLPINGVGLIYFGRKDYETARRYYQLAIQRDSNWAYPYNNMGTAYYMQRNYYEAKGFYQKATQLAPRWARPHSWLGDIAMKEQDYNTAIAEFTQTLDANATGTKNMDLEKIRRQLALAQERAAASSL